MGISLLECIEAVCNQADDTNTVLQQTQSGANALALDLENSGASLKCVVNGPAGQVCDLPLGGSLPTLAEAIARLNACQIAGVQGQSFTATAGQTVFTLATAPINPYALEVSLDGAICTDSLDYTLAGAVITFAEPLLAGDTVDTRSFIV